MKARRTAAIVARSLLAAERSRWLVGVLVGWVVFRREIVWPVSWDVAVAVDMGARNLLDDWMGGSAAKTGGACWVNPLAGDDSGGVRRPAKGQSPAVRSLPTR